MGQTLSESTRVGRCERTEQSLLEPLQIKIIYAYDEIFFMYIRIMINKKLPLKFINEKRLQIGREGRLRSKIDVETYRIFEDVFGVFYDKVSLEHGFPNPDIPDKNDRSPAQALSQEIGSDSSHGFHGN